MIPADADSISEQGDRITTFELEYQRFIHSELMTHRVFSRNAASSRAIPIEKVIDQVRNNPAMPYHWGKNQTGMQSKEELTGESLVAAKRQWKQAAHYAAGQAEILNTIGGHKQFVNRILEPFMWMKVVVTATSFDNWFWLRCHEDAQPEIKILADLMYQEYCKSNPTLLTKGMWHTPYYYQGCWKGVAGGVDSNNMTSEEALMISSSCCAQVSFRTLDDDLEKAERIYDRLVDSVPVHASPFEHQATPLVVLWNPDSYNYPNYTYPKGVTHTSVVDNHLDEPVAYSGNFKEWIQYRQLIKNNVCNDYAPES